MRTSSLETLEKAELPAGQARAILKAMESELAASHEDLATRLDFVALKAEIKAEFAAVNARFAAVNASFDAVNARFDAVNARFDVVDARFGAMATKAELQELGSKLSWMVLGCSFTQLAFLAGAVYFLYAHPGR